MRAVCVWCAVLTPRAPVSFAEVRAGFYYGPGGDVTPSHRRAAAGSGAFTRLLRVSSN